MKKIPTLFARDEATNRRYVRDEVTPGCEWVLAGEGTPTRKYDGACVLVRDGRLYKRRQIKVAPTEVTQFPHGFERIEFDEATQKWVGWVPIADGPDDALLRETFGAVASVIADGTYEFCGPKVNGNPEGLNAHFLIGHGAARFDPAPPTDFDGLAAWLHARPVEGIVWHHFDGRRAKIKRKDFPATNPHLDVAEYERQVAEQGGSLHEHP